MIFFYLLIVFIVAMYILEPFFSEKMDKTYFVGADSAGDAADFEFRKKALEQSLRDAESDLASKKIAREEFDLIERDILKEARELREKRK